LETPIKITATNNSSKNFGSPKEVRIFKDWGFGGKPPSRGEAPTTPLSSLLSYHYQNPNCLE
jgi:hypothetical protein